MPRPRTKQIQGYRVQPLLPMQFPYFGAVIDEADFTEYDGRPCVEVLATIGSFVKGPYTLVLSIEQALEADIVEKI